MTPPPTTTTSARRTRAGGFAWIERGTGADRTTGVSPRRSFAGERVDGRGSAERRSFAGERVDGRGSAERRSFAGERGSAFARSS
jgi:hypothetical protein